MLITSLTRSLTLYPPRYRLQTLGTLSLAKVHINTLTKCQTFTTHKWTHKELTPVFPNPSIFSGITGRTMSNSKIDVSKDKAQEKEPLIDSKAVEHPIAPEIVDYSASLEKSALEPEKSALEPEKSALEPEKSAAESKKLSTGEKLKLAVRDYGGTVLVFHITMSLMSLGSCYLLVSSGLDIIGLLTRIGVSESILENKMTQGGSTFVLAYAIHKVFAPLRLGITLTAVPFIVKKLRKAGFLKQPST